MQKTFKNQQAREILFVQVPLDCNEFCISHRSSGVQFLSSRSPKSKPKPFGWAHSIIPDGKYQILCLAKGATEEQAKQIVDRKQGVLNYFYDYEFNFYSYNSCAIKSLTSLLTSLGFKQDDNVIILEKI